MDYLDGLISQLVKRLIRLLLSASMSRFQAPFFGPFSIRMAQFLSFVPVANRIGFLHTDILQV
jgi:hypothetical protein